MIGPEYDRLAMDDGAIHYTTSADGTSIAWRSGGRDVDIVWFGGLRRASRVASSNSRFVQRFFDRVGAFARVVAFDKRGQGLSDRPDRAATMEEHADDVLAVMDAAGIERPTLVGVSEGGPAAIVFAAAHPDRIGKLVLYGTYARLLRDDDYPEGATLAGTGPDPRAEHSTTGAIRSRCTVSPRRWQTTARSAHGGRDCCASGSAGPACVTCWTPGSTWTFAPRSACPRAHARDVPQHGPDDSVHVDPVPRRPHRGARIVDLGPGGPPSSSRRHRADPARAARLRHRHARRPGSGGRAGDGRVHRHRRLDRARRRARRREWHRVLERHDDLVRTSSGRWRGREVKQLGDGFLASFEGPARAIRCARRSPRASPARARDPHGHPYGRVRAPRRRPRRDGGAHRRAGGAAAGAARSSSRAPSATSSSARASSSPTAARGSSRACRASGASTRWPDRSRPAPRRTSPSSSSSVRPAERGVGLCRRQGDARRSSRALPAPCRSSAPQRGSRPAVRASASVPSP